MKRKGLSHVLLPQLPTHKELESGWSWDGMGKPSEQRKRNTKQLLKILPIFNSTAAKARLKLIYQ
jgi:hypothetical protein